MYTWIRIIVKAGVILERPGQNFTGVKVPKILDGPLSVLLPTAVDVSIPFQSFSVV
jgi:hypothetical protein